MTNELLNEAIYAVALRDKLNKYPSGCFAQLYYNYIKNLEPKCDKTFLFYHLCVEVARTKGEKWTRIVGCTYPDLRETYTKIVEYIPFPEDFIQSRWNEEETIEHFKRLDISHCINGKYFCPLHELDYTGEEFCDILRKCLSIVKLTLRKNWNKLNLTELKRISNEPLL